MKYIIEAEKIIIQDKSDFCPKHIFECGQVFRYFFKDNKWGVVSGDKYAEVKELDDEIVIVTNHPVYFVNYFDLDTDYTTIKEQVRSITSFNEIVNCAEGIRILKQNLFETMVSFIVSANNNIKRIKKILNGIAEQCGTKFDNYFAFPTQEQLINKNEQFFKKLGAGYRASYLVKFVSQFEAFSKLEFDKYSTNELRRELIKLSGIGPKVADCILLFAIGRTDVFPVDTWMEKAYYQFFSDKTRTRKDISSYLVDRFHNLSGYIQQYMFYYKTIEKK